MVQEIQPLLNFQPFLNGMIEEVLIKQCGRYQKSIKAVSVWFFKKVP